MSNQRIFSPRDFDLGFSFFSFGVTVDIKSDDSTLLHEARDLVVRAFGKRVEIFDGASVEGKHTFALSRSNGQFRLYKNGTEIASGPSERLFFNYLNSMLRLEVGESARGRIFVHAGVVGWKGQAIIFPAKSYGGKSTLTAELVRNGADYYSDEYAVLESDGSVSPFPRHLTLRDDGGKGEREVPPEELGGRIGQGPIPVGMVLLTSFSKGARWEPEVMGAGQGILEILANTLTIHRDPAFALKVLDLVARRAIIVRSPRGDVKKFAKFLLAFFDKHSKLAKMT